MNATIEHPVSTFFKKGIELSDFNIHKYTPCRGDIGGQSFTTASEGVTQIYSAVQFSPHGVTHFDLPSCLDKHELALADEYEGIGDMPKSPEAIVRVMESYSKVKVLDTVILDMSFKVDEIRRYIDPNTGYLSQDIKAPHFETMMQALEIKRDDDILKSISEKDLNKKLLILKTGWDKEFNTFSHSLNNPYFEFRHPFLTYPFLSYETLKWLLVDDEGPQIQGIGCETCGVNNPAYYAKPHFLPSYATAYYDAVKPPFRPASVLLLTNGLYYINHLTRLDQINSTKCFGKSCIIPIALGTYDAYLAKVIFTEEI
jgi:kynurenine formamidase